MVDDTHPAGTELRSERIAADERTRFQDHRVCRFVQCVKVDRSVRATNDPTAGRHGGHDVSRAPVSGGGRQGRPVQSYARHGGPDDRAKMAVRTDGSAHLTGWPFSCSPGRTADNIRMIFTSRRDAVLRRLLTGWLMIVLGGPVLAAAQAAPAAKPMTPPASQTTTAPAASGDTRNQNLRAYVELLRSDVRGQKVAILTELMELTEAQDTVFWPIYRQYRRRAEHPQRRTRRHDQELRRQLPQRQRRGGRHARTQGTRSADASDRAAGEVLRQDEAGPVAEEWQRVFSRSNISCSSSSTCRSRRLSR